MKNIVIILLIAGVLVSIAGCVFCRANEGDSLVCNVMMGKRLKGSGVLITKTVSVPAFHAVKASQGAQVTIVSGTGDITVESDDNVMEQVVVAVKEGVLKIGFGDSCNSVMNVTLNVTVPSDGHLSELRASGAAKIVADGVLEMPEIEIGASGASRIAVMVKSDRCEVDASGASRIEVGGQIGAFEADGSGASKIKAVVSLQSCDIDLSGASSMILEGAAGNCEVEVSSASKLDAGNFTAENCNVEASSASNVSIGCSKMLNAKASSAARVTYSGDCLLGNISMSSAGSISKQ